jgi:hypothetical protein
LVLTLNNVYGAGVGAGIHAAVERTETQHPYAAGYEGADPLTRSLEQWKKSREVWENQLEGLADGVERIRQHEATLAPVAGEVAKTAAEAAALVAAREDLLSAFLTRADEAGIGEETLTAAQETLQNAIQETVAESALIGIAARVHEKRWRFASGASACRKWRTLIVNVVRRMMYRY